MEVREEPIFLNATPLADRGELFYLLQPCPSDTVGQLDDSYIIPEYNYAFSAHFFLNFDMSRSCLQIWIWIRDVPQSHFCNSELLRQYMLHANLPNRLIDIVLKDTQALS